MKNILVIGSQGYLGSRLTDYFQENGYSATGVDVGFFKNGVLYEAVPVPTLDKDASALGPEDIEGFDVVIQLAGVANDPLCKLDSEKIYHPSRDYTLRIAELCKKAGVRYIFPSSCSVYGISEGVVDEKSRLNPQTPYSKNKAEIEEGLMGLCDKSFSPIALRLATVFGLSPRIRFDIVINMLCGMALTQGKIALNSDGQAWRPHVYIDDVCEAFRRCVEWEYKGGDLLVLNVGRNDNNCKILDLAQMIQKTLPDCTLTYLGKSSAGPDDSLFQDRKIQDGVDQRTYQVAFDKIHKTLPGFEAKWDITRGIARLIEDLRKWKVDDVKFRQRDFYRLQQLEFLLDSGQLNETLTWKFRQ